ADQPSLEIAGHASLAYTGDDALVWFIGFVSVDAEHRIAIALVIENSDDIGLAARIGGEVLGAAAAFTP
ncbi:MAG: cell division protein FtsI, partial [Chloroflexota bacterium]|nr:cell division protein FtsI [Chloroflexota bacterium]